MLILYLLMIDSNDDKNKFELIYNQYKNLMLNRAYDIIRDRGLAEDAVHNAFLNILKNLSKIDDVNSKKTKGFVIVITKNCAKKIYNKQKKIVSISIDDNAPTDNLEEEFEVKEQIRIIKERIKLLPDIYREVLILKYYNELSYKEISQVLNVPATTIRKRIYRGRLQLLRGVENE